MNDDPTTTSGNDDDDVYNPKKTLGIEPPDHVNFTWKTATNPTTPSILQLPTTDPNLPAVQPLTPQPPQNEEEEDEEEEDNN